MFETLFTRPGIAERYRGAPLLDERLGYLRHCVEGGARRQTLRKIAAHQVSLVRLHGPARGRARQHDTRGSRGRPVVAPRRARCSRPASSEARKRFIGHAGRWLRFADLLDEPAAKTRHAHVREASDFEDWMRDERAWSEETVRGCLGAVDRFLEGLDERKVTLAEVGIADIDLEG